jgi:hypothetical protein
MPDYKTMYFELFNKVTDAIEVLKKAQQDAEERYISDGNEAPGQQTVCRLEKRGEE